MAGKPNPLVPNFNNPTSGLKPPRARPAPKKTAPKKGPYSKTRPVAKGPKGGFGTQARVPSQYQGSEVTVKHGKSHLVAEGTNLPVTKHQAKVVDRNIRHAQRQRARVAANLASVNNPRLPGAGKGDGTNLVSSSMSLNNPKYGPPAAQTLRPVGAATKSIVENLPDYTLGPDLTATIEGKPHSGWGLGLDVASMLPVFRGPARIADVGEHIAQGMRAGHDAAHIIEGAKQVARNGANPENRALDTIIGRFENPASRSRVMRVIQRTMDKAAQKSLDVSPELQGHFAPKYVQHFVNTARFYANNAERVIGEVVKSHSLSKTERVALEVAVHEVPISQVIRNKEALLRDVEVGKEGTHSADWKRLTDEIGLLRKSSHLLKDIPAHAATGVLRGNLAGHIVKPVFAEGKSTGKLHAALEDLITASNMRDAMANNPELLRTLGWQPLTPEVAAARRSAPGRFHLGARWQSEHQPLTAEADPGTIVRVGGTYTGRVVKFATAAETKDEVSKLESQLANFNDLSGRGLNNTQEYNAAQREKIQQEIKTLQSGQNVKIAIMRRGTNKHPVKIVPLSSLEEKLPGKLVGHEDFNGGLAYIPSVSANKKIFQKTASFGGQILPRSVAGGSEFKHPYTAANEEAGLGVHHPTELVGGYYNQMQRMNSAARELDAMREGGFTHAEIGTPKLAKAGISSRGFVPVRVAKQLSTESQIALEDMRNPEKMDELLHGALTHTIEADPKDVVFVPKALVGDLLKAPASQSEALKYLKDFSLLIKNILVYTKFPGHIPPRLLSNTTMAAIHQGGVGLAINANAAFKMSTDFPDVVRTWDAAMGTRHTFSSFGQEQGHKWSKKLGDTLARPVIWGADLGPRRTAIAEELAQAYGRRLNVPEMASYSRRLSSAAPGTEDAKTWRMVTQRGRRAAGEYGRSNSLERKIAPFVFLYQWGKVAMNITVKSALEHPVRTGAILGSVGKYAFHPGNRSGQQFGVQLPNGKFVNLTTGIPFSTPFEYGKDLFATEQTAVQQHKPQFGVGVGEVLNPGIPLLAEIGLGYNPTTGATASGLGALQELGRQTPVGALAFGKHALNERIGKFLFGNEYPQTLNPSSSGGGGAPGPALKLNGHQLKLIHRASLHLSPHHKLILKKKLKQLQIGH